MSTRELSLMLEQVKLAMGPPTPNKCTVVLALVVQTMKQGGMSKFAFDAMMHQIWETDARAEDIARARIKQTKPRLSLVRDDK